MRIGGKGEVVEWVTHMRRFDENATLDRVAARSGVTDEIIDELAIAIRRSHARAPLRDAARSARALETYIEQNGAAFAERPDLFDAATARKLTVDARLAFAIVRPVLLKRGEAGFVRRCHGDLHLRNIVLIDGEPTLFDALEFSDEIASGDVLYDLAFLLMDLEQRGLRASANRLFNRYLAPEPPEALDRPRRAAAVPEPARGDPGQGRSGRGAERLEGEKRDRGACALQPLLQSGGRISPPMLRRDSSRSADYPALAKARSRARSLLRLGRAPGALWLRSDVERKAMLAVEETVRLPGFGLRARGHPPTSTARLDRQGPASRLRAGQAVAPRRDLRERSNGARRPARRRRSASPSRGCFSTRRSRRGSSGSPRGAATLRTPTPTSRAGRRSRPLGERGWVALDAGESGRNDECSRWPGSGALERLGGA